MKASKIVSQLNEYIDLYGDKEVRVEILIKGINTDIAIDELDCIGLNNYQIITRIDDIEEFKKHIV